MPYLLKKDKDSIDFQGGVDVYEKFASMSAQDFAGALNYFNFKAVKIWVKKNGLRYWVCALVVGTLLCCILEIWLKIVCPYERKKEEENGTVDAE